MRDRYVIVEHTDRCFVLGLDGRDEQSAKQAIGWQRTGGFTEEMHICTYDRDREAFVGPEGTEFRPEQGFYTAAAWGNFTADKPISDGPHKQEVAGLQP